jgi:hypothetical protein
MPKKHFIKETLDSGHSYGGGRLHTFMTECGKRMQQTNQRNWYKGGNKGTFRAEEVTCKACLETPRVRKELAEMIAKRCEGKSKHFSWWEDDGDRRWKSSGA